MKTFRQYIAEDYRSEVVPAIRGRDGKIHRGKRGEDHSELRMRKMTKPGEPLDGESGYYHRNTGFVSKIDMGHMDSTRFLSPQEKAEREHRREKEYREKRGLDTTDMMSPLQRMRKYGTFEE